MKMKLGELEQKIESLLEQRGFDAAQRELITKPIMWAVTHGNNQGLLKLVGEPALVKNTYQGACVIVQESASTAEVNGCDNNAMIAVDFAVKKSLEQVKATGVSVVGVNGTHSSSGALAYYAELLSCEGYVAIITARTPAMVTPVDSLEPFFGTNPIAFSFPTNDEPLTFDMATAAIAWYGILEASAKGARVPDGMIEDAFGNPTNDPNVAINDGHVVPFGGHKGSNLGLMVELLGGLLVGGAFGPNTGDWGHLIIAIDPERLHKADKSFATRCSEAIAQMRMAKTKSGKPLRLPGDRAKHFYDEVMRAGEIEVDESTMKKLGW